MTRIAVCLLLVGCSSHPFDNDDAGSPPPVTDASADVHTTPPVFSDASVDAAPPPPQCGVPPNPASPTDVVMNATFAKDYATYVLGLVPGIPPSRLGGCVVDINDPNALLVATDSEDSAGAIYSIPVTREPCGHITGFAGNAKLVATTPYVDANLLYGPNQILFYSQWPVNQLSELLPNQSTPAYTRDLSTISVGGGGPGGIGFVPPNLADPGGLRAVTWPSGYFYHLTYAKNGQTFDVTSATQTVTLPNGPGGFGYVPQGSPQFAKQSLITPEWPGGQVAVYEVDGVGDPIVSTRRQFFDEFPVPWGAYFEPTTGDFIFLSWGSGNDQIYIVQGFAQPPPPPPPPK
jgi:hypothetical protein